MYKMKKKLKETYKIFYLIYRIKLLQISVQEDRTKLMEQKFCATKGEPAYASCLLNSRLSY